MFAQELPELLALNARRILDFDSATLGDDVGGGVGASDSGEARALETMNVRQGVLSVVEATVPSTSSRLQRLQRQIGLVQWTW